MLTLNGLIAWLTQYKALALFLLLALGIVGLPIPDETLMTFAGILIAKGYLEIVPTLCAAYSGSIAGISLSYFIGRTAGSYLLNRYGRYLGLTEKKINKAHVWFEKIGKWTLLVGYFIPGIRHLTGYVAGATELRFSQFAIFAYTGAFIWASLFLMLGYFSSQHWERVVAFTIDNIEHIVILLLMVLLISVGLRIFYKNGGV